MARARNDEMPIVDPGSVLTPTPRVVRPNYLTITWEHTETDELEHLLAGFAVIVFVGSFPDDPDSYLLRPFTCGPDDRTVVTSLAMTDTASVRVAVRSFYKNGSFSAWRVLGDPIDATVASVNLALTDGSNIEAVQTVDYVEDGGGAPTAGARFDTVTGELKVSPDSLVVGQYSLNDMFYKSLAALADDTERVWYRGNMDPDEGFKPNVDKLSIVPQSGFLGGPAFAQWAFHIDSGDVGSHDNLDGLRHLEARIFVGDGVGATVERHTIYAAVQDRRYEVADDAGGADQTNRASGQFSTGFDDDVNPITGLGSAVIQLLARIVGVQGTSDERWFHPPAAWGTACTRDSTTPYGDTPAVGTGTSGSGGGVCVAPETLVLMDDGTELPAGLVRAGDSVLTLHENTLRPGKHRVVAATSHRVRARVRLVLKDGRELICTPGHRLYVAKVGWVRADGLRRGDQLVGLPMGIVVGSEPAGPGTVVRMTVAGARTYMSAGLLSHNLKPR